jgi:hypothetical protein
LLIIEEGACARREPEAVPAQLLGIDPGRVFGAELVNSLVSRIICVSWELIPLPLWEGTADRRPGGLAEQVTLGFQSSLGAGSFEGLERELGWGGEPKGIWERDYNVIPT